MLYPTHNNNQSLILPKHSQFNYNYSFFHHWSLPNLLKYFKLRDSNILPWKVYTAKDFQLHESSKTGKIGKPITVKSNTFNPTPILFCKCVYLPLSSHK